MMSSVGIISTALRRPQTYAGYLQEAWSAAQCVARYPLGVVEGAFSTGEPSGDVAHDTPVLLVHGFGHNRSGWYLLEKSLRRAGFSSVHTMNYVAGRKRVPELAARLAGRVEEIRALTGAEKVHIVGHSLGGVLLRWYVQEMGGHERVDTAITIASPHEGTFAALGGIGSATARDLRPGSWVVRRLLATARSSDVRWIGFHSNIDGLVIPASSAMIRPAALRATNIFVKDHAHLTIMLSPVVARSIVSQLEASESGVGDVVPIGAPADASEVGVDPRHPAFSDVMDGEAS